MLSKILSITSLAAVVAHSASPQSSSTSDAGRTVSYNLNIAEQSDQPASGRVGRLTVNGSSPGPVLRFREGDIAHLVVRNDLEDEDASIHWHGLLLPNAMDGVPYLTTPSIAPGASQEYRFELRQAGTYWYHSHTGLQEQRGVYGAIVIEAREARADLIYDREHVVVLSDWTDESPTEVMRTLMRGSDWYALRKGNMQSIAGAWEAGELGGYFDRQRRRMPAMDVSDVAYDAFLANGVERLELDAQPGERVLIRVVNAGASSYFHLHWAAGPLSIVAADGMDVEPVDVRRLLISMAETYDFVVTMPSDATRVELRATAQDVSGHASIFLGQGTEISATDPPAPNLYTMTDMVRAGLESIHPKRGLAAGVAERPFAPYSLLRATSETTIAEGDDDPRIRKITMRLTGDMQRYIWGIDGKMLSEDSTIPIKHGEILRIELVNDTMMHHPMHLHGHFFRVLNGQGTHAPLKHTVDVPPMGKRVIEWIAGEEGGDWFFHCHLLYHMDAGMARVFSYRDNTEENPPQFDPGLIAPKYLLLDATVLTHMTMGKVTLMDGRESYLMRWDAGIGHDHHHDGEVDFLWASYVDPNLSTLAGYRLVHGDEGQDRAFIGLSHRLPYFVMAELTADSRADARIELDKEFQLTDRLGFSTNYEYDTGTGSEWSVASDWTINKRSSFVANYDSTHGFGVGVQFNF
ncbi:MAG: FtsP/CotA-like multicopper oxidase with cupredoxin domain [Planctomycetota bacterium]|jgi:FtsP/CotA-like multicopper oxidase with cupredoxin domain